MNRIKVSFAAVKSFTFVGKELELRLKTGQITRIPFGTKKEMMDETRQWVNESMQGAQKSPEMEAIKACRNEVMGFNPVP